MDVNGLWIVIIRGYLSHDTTASTAHIYPAQIFKLPNLR